MQVRYRLIDNGNVVNEQLKDFDGDQAMNMHRMESDLFDGMDPLELARAGERVVWVEALPI